MRVILCYIIIYLTILYYARGHHLSNLYEEFTLGWLETRLVQNTQSEKGGGVRKGGKDKHTDLRTPVKHMNVEVSYLSTIQETQTQRSEENKLLRTMCFTYVVFYVLKESDSGSGSLS